VNLVDSSGWLEYLADGPGADFFALALENTEDLLVPTICLLEVARKLYRQRGQDAVIQTLALMKEGRVVQLTQEVILLAARVGMEHQLPLADSVIYATGRLYGATVWTQDSDFEGLDGVRYTPKVV
jgi:predicted nucleic acid-binding protein